MLNTIVKGRGTGKTKEVIKRMEEDKDLVLLIPYSNMGKLYPAGIGKRVYTINQLLSGLLEGKRIQKVIIDEGFLFNKDEIAKLYYFLGENHIDVEAYGTI